MNKIILDNPKVVTKTFIYTEFLIKDIIITLNKSAKFIVILYGDDTDVVDIEMTTEEYQNWGSDDDFVIQFIKQKLL